MDWEIDDGVRKKIVLALGVLIVIQAVMGTYFIATGETKPATIAFSTLAVLSGSMAAISANMGEE